MTLRDGARLLRAFESPLHLVPRGVASFPFGPRHVPLRERPLCLRARTHPPYDRADDDRHDHAHDKHCDHATMIRVRSAATPVAALLSIKSGDWRLRTPERR